MSPIVMKGQVNMGIIAFQSQALVVKAHGLTQQQLVLGLKPDA